MYFDFEDHRPETPILERPLTRLEQILLTVIAYLLIVIGLIIYPRLPFVKAFEAARLEKLAEERKLQEERREPMQYVFAMPKVQRERIPPKPKYLSDESHTAQTNQRVQIPKNDVPASRGDSPEKRIADSSQPQPDTSREATAPPRGDPNALALPSAPQATIVRNEPSKNPTLEGRAPGLLSDAIRNVQKYTQGETLQNVQGNGDFGPSIQFDSKGVDFGPWLRRFIAQIRRNWFVPYAAMSLRGHVVLSFKVHRDGSITELQVNQPSTIDAFTKSAFNAIKLSNPTVPLPLEFPDENAPFIVSFYFNETPPGGGSQ
ncbi:MAG TPA: TonB family protein [Vicinamibacterales bacterium]|nr:TonB family protein [Vicinamibacterales bacterium]